MVVLVVRRVVVMGVRVTEDRRVDSVVGQGCSVVGQPAVAHDHGSVHEGGQGAELVGDQDDRGAALLEPAQ